MIKKDIEQYIFDKKIPISFIWKNNYIYWLVFYFENSATNTILDQDNDNFLKWKTSNDSYITRLFVYNNKKNIPTDVIFEITDPEMEKCLSEFMYWFELNKHRCTNIKYYENK